MCVIRHVLGSYNSYCQEYNTSKFQSGKTLFYQLSVSAILLLIIAQVSGEAGLIILTGLLIVSLTFQILANSFASYVVWFGVVKTYPAAELSSFVFLAPVFGVLFGTVLLSESVSLYLFAGMSLVEIGIFGQ